MSSPCNQSTYIVGKTLRREDLLSELHACTGVVGLDTETEGINPAKQAPACGSGSIACWSVSTPRYERVFLWADQLDYFKPWLESTKPKVGHNIYGFDKHMFANSGITLRGVAGDTLRMSKLLYCSKMRSHGLKDLARNWLGIEQPAFKHLFMRPKHTRELVIEKKRSRGIETVLLYKETKRKVGDKRGVPTILASGERGKFGRALEFIPLSRIPIDYPDRLTALYEYAAADALITRLLYDKLKLQLEKVVWRVDK